MLQRSSHGVRIGERDVIETQHTTPIDVLAVGRHVPLWALERVRGIHDARFGGEHLVDAPGRRARPGPGAAARLPRSFSDAPRRSRARGLRPPGSRAQRWVAQAGGAAAPDSASPGRPPSVAASGVVPGAPSECWGSRRGERVAREGLQIWGVLRRIADFKGLLWPCLAERVRGGGLAGKGCGHVALNS